MVSPGHLTTERRSRMLPPTAEPGLLRQLRDPRESKLLDALISQDLKPTRGQYHLSGAWLWGEY